MRIKRDYLQDDAWSKASTRQFHTQVFKISKAIRDEATGYLHRSHKFVRFYYSLSTFEDLVIACNVPLITLPSLRSTFNSHVLSLHARVSDVDNLPEKMMQKGATFLLAHDLPALCEVLRLLSQRTNMRYVGFHTPRNVQVRPIYETSVQYTLRLGVSARQTAFSVFDPTSQSTYLRRLRKIKGDVQITFHGFAVDLRAEINALVADRQYSLVWGHARDWDMLEWLVLWKSRMDAVASNTSPGKLKMAIQMFKRTTGVLQYSQ